MDLTHLILSLHVFAAISLGAALSVTAVSLHKSVANYYRPLTFTLAGLVSVLSVTGVALYLLTPSASIVELCANMGIYLSLTAVAEYLLIKNIRQASAKAELEV